MLHQEDGWGSVAAAVWMPPPRADVPSTPYQHAAPRPYSVEPVVTNTGLILADFKSHANCITVSVSGLNLRRSVWQYLLAASHSMWCPLMTSPAFALWVPMANKVGWAVVHTHLHPVVSVG